MQALATLSDYELLIGPVDPADEPRLDYILNVASAVVVTVAPGLYQWVVDPADWPLDETGTPIDPGPVPSPAVLVTCQVAARFMADPTGSEGPVSMERIGLAQTHYDTTYSWAVASGLLPGGWRLMLKPWRPPEMASIQLVVPHPHEGLWDDGLWFLGGEIVPEPPTTPPLERATP